MLEGIVKKIQDDMVLIETKKGNLTLPVFAIDHMPRIKEKVYISVSSNDMTKKIINELLGE